MSIFKCKICGGALEVDGAQSVATCEYCGTKQTLPKLDDEHKANLYDRANHFRRNNDFDKAMGIYENILNEDSTDAEAYWSLVLCRWGIEYVEDPATHKRVPTVNRAQFTSIFDDEDYKSAIEHADEYQREIYESEAAAINEIQKGILAISEKEEPFDVFICYKETDSNGRRTHDSVLATELYQELKREGFKVFFSRITLEDKLGIAYEPYIFAALHSSKVMVVIGTRPEHFNAVWVKNEWSRYLALIKSGAKKTLIPAYRDMDPYDLPEEFSHLQAQDMSKLGFMQDLTRGIKKIIGSAQQKQQPKTVPIAQVAPTAPEVAPLLKRAFLFLEDGEFDNANEYAEKILDIDPECAEAYLAKLMVDLRLEHREELANQKELFKSNKNYQKTIRFASNSLKAEIAQYVATAENKIEEARKEGIYLAAKTTCSANIIAKDIPELQNAIEQLSSIRGYKDSDELIKQGEAKIEEARQESIYVYAKKACAIDFVPSAIPQLQSAIKHFSSISGYKDSDILIQDCEVKITKLQQLQAEQEKARLEKARQVELKRIRVEKNVKRLKKISLIATPIIIITIALSVLISNYYESHYKKPTIDGIKYEKISEGYRLVGYVGNDTSIVIPDEVRGKPVIEISEEAFRNRSSITSVTIPDSVTAIGSSAFWDCDNLTSITIPDSVTSIGFGAFYDCSSLTSVTIGNSVESIGDSAFRDCDNLSTITIPDSVTSIGDSAFYLCDNLTSVTIGNSVESIGDFAFYLCYNLTSVTIPDSVTSISYSAFEYCTNLVEVINKSSLPITAGSSDYGYVGYHAIEVHNGESKIKTVNDYLFYTCDGVNYLLGYMGKDTNLTLPESYNGENYEIYDYAFNKRNDIMSVTIPDSVTAIGSSAFWDCDNLTSVTIGSDVTSIGDHAFDLCPIKHASIPASAIYYIPKTKLETVIITSGDSIGDEAFRDCDNLTSVTIGNSVESIGDFAFWDCDNLTSVTIGNSVESIGDFAFRDCDNLSTITIPDSVTSIGASAFYNCYSLTSVTIGGNVTSIGDFAFDLCTNLKTVINKSNLYIEAGSKRYGYVAYYADTVTNE